MADLTGSGGTVAFGIYPVPATPGTKRRGSVDKEI
jgi:hypothetical protein